MSESGPFVWHELRVPDLEEAERFYGGVFGWAFTDNPMGRSITHRGVVIGGASAVKVGLAGHWTPYIACADVDAAAARAVAAGGIVTTGQPADVPGIGRIAPILDPEKSIFVAFDPTADRTAPPYEPGRFGWERLRAADVAAAAEFYAATFGWQVTVGEGGGVVHACGLRVAELVPDESASGWLPFVRVEDLTVARRRIVALGGAAEEPVLWRGSAGYALVRDPQRVAFAVHAG
jgi:predicted enzyme related to lactoylglutathione lyase